jgi:hypothetical protein
MRELEEMGITHGNLLRTYKWECQKRNPGTAVRLRTLSLSLSLFSLSFSDCGRALGLCAVGPGMRN